MRTIGELFEIQLGKMLNKDAKTGRNTAKYVGNRAVQWERIDLSALEEMDFSDSERVKFQLIPGDLLVCEGGDVGRTAMWQDELQECYYQKAIHRLRPRNKNVSNQFMLYFMRYAYDSGEFRLFTSQSSIAHLTQEKLSMVLILLPEIHEQAQISARCSSLSERIELFTRDMNKLSAIKNGLMHDLLSGTGV